MFFHSQPQCGAMPGPAGMLAVCMAVVFIAAAAYAMRLGRTGRTWGPFR